MTLVKKVLQELATSCILKAARSHGVLTATQQALHFALDRR